MKKPILILIFFICASLNAQIISPARTTDWSRAGYEGSIPNPSNVIDVTSFGAIGDSVTDNHASIVQAMNSLNRRQGVVYFPPGNYLIQSAIAMNDSVILRGSSSDSTHLIFDFSGVAGNCINITGTVNSSFVNVINGFNKNSSFVVVDSVTGFSTGDFAEIQQDNGSWDTQPVFWADHSVGQIIRIVSISGDSLFIDPPLRIDYDSSLNVQIRKFIPAQETGIECLSILRRDNVASGVCFNMYFDHAVNCWVRGVESSQSIGSHIEVDASSHIDITGNYLHHAFAYDGVSTHGYGITLFKHTGDCKVENNILRYLRHSISLQCGANGNVVAYNYSTEPNRTEFPSNLGADISMHGHYPFSNLFEGNIIQTIQLDQTWGPSGPFNTFFRNRAELYGILMSSGTVNSDSQNFVGNEVPNMGTFLGNYLLAGNGHFEYGNNVRGIVIPSGTIPLNDSSYYLRSIPVFWNIPDAWPSIGDPNLPVSGSIPARERFLSGIALTSCGESVVTSVELHEHPISEWEIYPNPSHGVVNIKLNRVFQPEEKITFLVVDVLGNKIIKKRMTCENKIIQLNIPEAASAGIYFLTVQSETMTFTGKFILN